MMQSFRRLLGIAVGVLMFFVLAGPAQGQQLYKIVSSTEVVLYEPSGTISGQVSAIDQSLAASASIASTFTTVVPGTQHWFDVTFGQPVFWVASPAHSYILYYSVQGSDGSVALGKPLAFKLSPNLTVTPDALQGEFQRGYYLESSVALMVGGQYLLDAHQPCPATATGEWQATEFNSPQPASGPVRRIPAVWRRHLVSKPSLLTNPIAIGAIQVCLNHSLVWRQNQVAIDPASTNAFLASVSVDPSLIPAGGSAAVQLDPSSAFTPPVAPATKDAASFYANLFIAAATGAHGAWGLDGKVALINIPSLGGSLTLLSATANTGNNTSNISGQTYTDSIDWMLPQSWAIPIWTQKLPTLLTMSISPKYETDYKFDKKNLLAAADTIWSAQRLYQPQNYRSTVTGGVLPKYGDKGYATFGYELEFHAGLEAGGALLDTTQQNSKKTATITVPSYGITRVVPQVHGLWQQGIGRFGNLSFDSLLTSRYLFQRENTVHELKDNSLLLVPVSGWKAINTLTSIWNPPMSNNVGLTATYKTGFDAPKFLRVNSVLIGVLIEF